MSSILEALKKLEQGKEDMAQDFDWPQSVNTRAALHDRLVGRSPIGPVLATVVLGLVLAASLFFLFHNSGSTPPESPVLTAMTPSAERTVPVVAEPRPVTADTKARHNPDASPLTENPQPDPPQPEEPDMPAEPGPDQTLNIAAAPPPALKVTPLPPSLATEKAEQEPELDQEMTELLNRIPADLLPPRKLVDSGWLTLHAISWSEDPGRRIAVINAQLVKEGRRLDGALIRRIDRDYVVIEKDGEQLMLPFGNH